MQRFARTDRDKITGQRIAVLPQGTCWGTGIETAYTAKPPDCLRLIVLETPYHKIEDAVTGAMEEVTLQSMIDDFHRMVPDPTAAAK